MGGTEPSSERVASPLVGLIIVASLAAGRLVGRIVATTGDLALIRAAPESDIQGPGLILLKLGSVAMPEGRCRLFRTRKEAAQAVSGDERPPVRERPRPRLVATRTSEGAPSGLS